MVETRVTPLRVCSSFCPSALAPSPTQCSHCFGVRARPLSFFLDFPLPTPRTYTAYIATLNANLRALLLNIIIAAMPRRAREEARAAAQAEVRAREQQQQRAEEDRRRTDALRQAAEAQAKQRAAVGPTPGRRLDWWGSLRLFFCPLPRFRRLSLGGLYEQWKWVLMRAHCELLPQLASCLSSLFFALVFQ